MAKYCFNSDYTEGCHPQVLEALAATNMVQCGGYGLDAYCEEARALVKKVFACPQADVHFLTGGTQANLTIVCAALRPHQGVYVAASGHPNNHEAGALEHQGHRVLTLPTQDGKLYASQVEEAYRQYAADPYNEHWCQPKMVYISQPTEIGSLYSRQELAALYQVCRRYGLYLFVDGARLGYGLAAPASDMSPADLAANCDVFYAGGTKCGLLCGEAVVILHPDLKPDFRTIAKQNGAILSKGRFLGVQFAALFKDGLYWKICRYGTLQALRLKEALAAKGIAFVTDSPTNQQFAILTPAQYAALSQDFELGLTEYLPGGLLNVRFCTSWATDPAQVDRLIAAIQAL